MNRPNPTRRRLTLSEQRLPPRHKLPQNCSGQNYINRLEIDSYEWDKLVLSITTWTKDTHMGPRKPHPITKHEVDRTTGCGDMAI